ncbi:putative ISXo8 transposase [Xanthomonas oryzae pv. oryzae KACC 10331]|uniref:ISXo8 transposase n=1 Tax=Xanthomonas oryzae pv. oryzae (strain KACC10331 / KXO85) TaxID=291331 RepID=Q5GZG5_XANOR|nr:putative ISXo8 transposase [Xanthomonas oryzae pv. oryzae KACC 10331]
MRLPRPSASPNVSCMDASSFRTNSVSHLWCVVQRFPYGFLMRERLRSKKNSVAFKMPAVSKSVRPRGSSPNATSPSQLDCHAGLRTG